MEECKNGQKNFLATRAKLAEHPVEKVGTELRAMMPWISKKKLVDSDKCLILSVNYCYYNSIISLILF